MAITRVSKFISVGVIALTLAPIVFGKGGGGGGDGPPEEGTMAPSVSRSNSASLSFSGTIISSASITPPPGDPPGDISSSTSSSSSTGVSTTTVPPTPVTTNCETSSSMGSGSVTGSRPTPDSSGGSGSTSGSTSTGGSTATVPPSPASTSTRGTSSSMGSGSVTGSRPPPDSSGGNGSASSSTSTGVSTTTVPPSPASTSTRGTSSSMGSGSVTSSRPPPDSSGGSGSTSGSTSTGGSTATVPPSPASTSTRGTSSSMGSGSVTGSRPPPDSSGGNGSTSSSTSTGGSTTTVPPRPSQASTATSATSITSASSSGADTSTLPPPRTSSSMGSGTITGSRPPPDSTGPPNGGGGSSGGMVSSTDEIYFPWLYTDECDHYGEDAHYGVTFSGSGVTMIRQVWSTTGCPNHVNWGIDKGMDYHFPARIYPSNESIPAYPMKFGDNGTTDLSTTNGQIATLVSGVALFSAWAKEPVTDWASTAFSTEEYTLDACGGHSTTEGWYHYHGTPGCLEEQIMMGENISMSEHSPFLGWSYDGFPMYGHLGPGGIEMRACDTDGADPVYCLDTCSGYEGVIPEIDDFTYRYYLTCGYDESFFPMTINCFRGCCPEGIECHETVEPCDDQAEVGYTDSYEPDLGYVYSEQYELEVLSGYDGDYINSSTGVNCSMFYNEDLVYTVQQLEDNFPGYNGTSWAPTSIPIGSPTNSPFGSSTSSLIGSPTSSSVGSLTSSPTSSPTSNPIGSPTSSPASISIGSSTSSPTSETDASGGEGNFAPGRHSPSRALYSLAGIAVAALGVQQWTA